MGQFNPAPIPIRGEVVLELPDDDETIFKRGEYEPLADFLAFVESARILSSGELKLSLGIPYEFKYDAMQLTDMRGVMFHVVVEAPKRPGRDNG